MTSPAIPLPAPVDRRHDCGPFDIIGDVHGCADELETLLSRLGYLQDPSGVWASPTGRTAIFVGDLVDRGPRNVDCLRTAMQMVAIGSGLWVPGNHDARLERYLDGEHIPLLYGLDVTVAEIDVESVEFRDEVRDCLRHLPGHLLLDDGHLVVAHTGLGEKHQGVNSDEVRHLAAYGVREGEPEPAHASMRHGWRVGYSGKAAVVYGHTAVREAVWKDNAIDIDTGCVFGGQLTALRWPETTIVAIPARMAYAEAPRHFLENW